jgi:hypothetical protein
LAQLSVTRYRTICLPSRFSKGVSLTRCRLARDVEIQEAGVEDAETENISGRKHFEFQPFKKRKGWAPVIFQDVVPLLRGRTTRSAKVEISPNDFQGGRLAHAWRHNKTGCPTLRGFRRVVYHRPDSEWL